MNQTPPSKQGAKLCLQTTQIQERWREEFAVLDVKIEKLKETQKFYVNNREKSTKDRVRVLSNNNNNNNNRVNKNLTHR